MTEYYGTVAGADAYHAARGQAAWIGSDAVKLQALLIASIWLDAAYAGSYSGFRINGRGQPREWPRWNAIDIYGFLIDNATVPPEIENATYEVALRQIMTPGIFSTDFVAAKQIISAAVSGAVSVTYSTAAGSSDVQLQMPQINQILYPILNANTALLGGVSSRSVRG